MRKLAQAFALLALAACSGGIPESGGASSSSSSSGSEAFARLLKEAGEAKEDGDLADAGRLLDEARALDPENPALWVAISRLRYLGGKQIDALEAADYAVEVGPNYSPALLLRGQLVRDAHGFSDALVWLEAAVEADPNDPLALAEYAATLGDAGYHSQMLAVTRALADIVPKDPRVFYLKAVLAARGGNPVLAKSLLERSGQIEKSVPAAMMLDALIDLQERNFDTASETLIALSEKQPGNNRVTELLARSLWMGGRDEQLIERFSRSAQSQDASPYLIMLVARALERQGDRAAAASMLERAYSGRSSGWVNLDDRPGLPSQTKRMRRFLAGSHFREADRLAQRLRRDFPSSSDIAALAGDAAMAREDYVGALADYRDAARVRRPWPLTRKAAAAYLDLGDPVAADVLLAKHLIGEPRNTEALLLNAERAARSEDWLRVVVLLDNAIDLGAGNDPRLLKLRGIAARALGREEEARQFEQMTWELHPSILPQG